ncbi:MAG: DUF4126 domain-containing protein [Planctomycetaceae bacterium]|jgi:hypothetical protein|nr:DUF4126 domain-containing protein [Phycisphaerales bacterium]MCE2654017.1 DUF4126 domain-containing protein [Planctomycetaceae bacterium]
MDYVLAALIGLGLAAACGFRVFLPVLVLAVAARAGAVQLAPSLSFLISDTALVALGLATALEIGGYWIPWLDHALDVAATPAAVVAGTLVAGSQWVPIGPDGELLTWALALIVGGGVAGAVQVGTVALRTASTAFTGGLGNPLFATAEHGAAAAISIAAITVPALAFVALLVGCLGVGFYLRARANRRAAASPQPLPAVASARNPVDGLPIS